MLGANVSAFLIPFAVLVATVFSPNEVFGANRTLHLKKPSKHLLELNKEVSQSGPKRSGEVQNSFSQSLFDAEENVEIRNLVKNTVFIRGMTSGLLNADDYGAYMVQDIAYLANGVKAYEKAAGPTASVDEKFKTFYRERAARWRSKYLEPMQNAWHLEDVTKIKTGTAAKAYMNFLTTQSQTNPKYLAIAMLPCTMLWRWLADQLVNSVSVYSAYYSWFQDYRSPYQPYQGSLESFVDEHFRTENLRPEDLGTAKLLFCKAMVHECNFFRESGNQEPCKIPPTCQGSSTSPSD